MVVVWWERPLTPLGAYTLTTEARDPPATLLAHPSFLSRSLTLFLGLGLGLVLRSFLNDGGGLYY